MPVSYSSDQRIGVGKKDEDRLSITSCSPLLFSLSAKVRKEVMQRSVLFLDRVLLSYIKDDGSTLSRLNLHIFRDNAGKTIIEATALQVGDSFIMGYDGIQPSGLLVEPHDFSTPEDREPFSKRREAWFQLKKNPIIINKYYLTKEQGKYFNSISMSHSMGDSAHKAHPAFTANPSITTTQFVLPPGKKYTFVVASDGIEFIPRTTRPATVDETLASLTSKHSTHRVIPEDFHTGEFEAEDMVMRAAILGSGDDISASVIHVRPFSKFEDEFYYTFGVYDGHGGSQTAILCDGYYNSIEMFWTAIYWQKLHLQYPDGFASISDNEISETLHKYQKELSEIQEALFSVCQAFMQRGKTSISFKDNLLHHSDLNKYFDKGLIDTITAQKTTLNNYPAKSLTFYQELSEYLEKHEFSKEHGENILKKQKSEEIQEIFDTLLAENKPNDGIVSRQRLDKYNEIYKLASTYFKCTGVDLRKDIRNRVLRIIQNADIFTHDLCYARTLDIISKHRNIGFFKTIGRTDTTIALDQKIQQQIEKELDVKNIGGLAPFPFPFPFHM